MLEEGQNNGDTPSNIVPFPLAKRLKQSPIINRPDAVTSDPIISQGEWVRKRINDAALVDLRIGKALSYTGAGMISFGVLVAIANILADIDNLSGAPAATLCGLVGGGTLLSIAGLNKKRLAKNKLREKYPDSNIPDPSLF